jgi:hypothetical protein
MQWLQILIELHNKVNEGKNSHNCKPILSVTTKRDYRRLIVNKKNRSLI